MTTMFQEKPTRINAATKELVASAVRSLNECGRSEEAGSIADLMRELDRRPVEVEIQSTREFSEYCYDTYVRLLPLEATHLVRLVHDDYTVEMEVEGRNVKVTR